MNGAPISVREKALSSFFALFQDLDAYPTKARLPTFMIDWRQLPAILQIERGSQILSGDDASSGVGGIGAYRRLALPVIIVVGVRSEDDPDALASRLNAARAEILDTVFTGMRSNPTLSGSIQWIRYDGDDDPVSSGEDGAPPHAAFPLLFSLMMTEAELDPYLN